MACLVLFSLLSDVYDYGCIMKEKWQKHWMAHARLLSQQSPCCRRLVGAVLIDEQNNPISAGFNGTPRGFEGALCGGGDCLRDRLSVTSGTRHEVGCLHAETNALIQALRRGISPLNCTLVVSCPPCLGCARIIGDSGIKSVVIPDGEYALTGADYLKERGLEIITLQEG